MLDIDQIANIINAAAVQSTDADVRVGMYRWISQFKVAAGQVEERIEFAAAAAIDVENYGAQYRGNLVGVRAAREMANILSTI